MSEQLNTIYSPRVKRYVASATAERTIAITTNDTAIAMKRFARSIDLIDEASGKKELIGLNRVKLTHRVGGG